MKKMPRNLFFVIWTLGVPLFMLLWEWGDDFYKSSANIGMFFFTGVLFILVVWLIGAYALYEKKPRT